MTTTFETSKRLKEAGFPQVFRADSFCYINYGGKYPHADILAVRGLLSAQDRIILAATESDILAELPPTFRLGANKLGVSGADFVVWNEIADDMTEIIAFHENAAEALALAWLDLEAAKKRAGL